MRFSTIRMTNVFRQWKIMSFLIIITPSTLYLFNELIFKGNGIPIIQNSKLLRNYERWILTSDITDLYSLLVKKETNWGLLTMKSTNRCELSADTLKHNVLTAVQLGAKFIYVSSIVTNETLKVLDKFQYKDTMSALRYSGTFSNPISLHFNGHPNISNINKTESLRYELGVWKTALLQKVINPVEDYLKFYDSRSPTLLLPFGSIQPFTNNNVMFHYNAFWAMIPIMKDNYRWSVWVQKLLSELGSCVSFLTSGETDNKNTCAEFFSETKFVNQELYNWKCKDRSTFFSCVLSLSKFMVKKQYMTNEEYNEISMWLETLLRAGYMQPKLLPQNSSKSSLEPVFNVLYHAAFMVPDQNSSQTFKAECKAGTNKCPMPAALTKAPSFEPWSNILLVIVYNLAGFYGGITHMEKLYRPFFKHILYCGSDMRNLMPTFTNLTTPISFVEVNQHFAAGQKGYQCLQLAMRMNYDVEGYLHLGDDVLLNLWNLHHLPTDKIWFQQNMRVANLSQPSVPDVWRNPNWWPWRSGYGRGAVTKAINRLRQLSKSDTLVKSFLEQLAKNADGKERVFYEVCDIVYFPQKLSKQFDYIVNVFYLNNVYLEITIPTVINGLVNQADIVRLNGSYLWYQDRVKYRETFDYKNVFLHALKTGLCLPDKVCRTFLCEKYLPCLYNLKKLK